MYYYAGSFKVSTMVEKSWQQAFSRSALKKVEISTGDYPPEELTQEVVPALLRMQQQGELEAASLHLPFSPFEEYDFSSLDENIRQYTVKQLIKYIRHYEGLHIPNITIHCSAEPIEAPRSARTDQVRRSCEELLPTLESLNTSLNLELLPRSCVGNTVEELLTILEGLPQKYFGICLDVNHGMKRGKEVPEMLLQCGKWLKTLHVSDYDNMDECHWNVGQGMLDWIAIRETLTKIPQELLVIIEVNPLSIPAWKNYTLDPSFNIRNIERNCMCMEYHREMEELLAKIRANGFKQTC